MPKSHFLKQPLLLGFLVALIYELPYILLGENSHIYILDNLDAVVSCLLIMVKTGHMFKVDSVVEPLMNGLPRDFLANGINISSLGYLFFSPFIAYIINDFLVHMIAFTGMYVFLDKYVVKSSSYKYLIILGIAVSWAFIPHFSIYGISVAGQPLLLYAFFNLKNGEKKGLSFFVIIFFVLYSMLVFVGVFLIITASIYFLYLWIIKKDFNKNILLATGILILSYSITEFQLIRVILFDNSELSHRTAWDAAYTSTGIYETLKKAAFNFIAGHWHAKSMHSFILLFSTIVVAFLAFFTSLKNISKKLLLIILILVIFNILYAFSKWNGILPVKEVIPLLKSFQVSRLIWLTPILWYILFALSLEAASKLRFGKYVVCSVIIAQVFYLTLYHSEIQQRTQLVYKETGAKVSYKEFYSESLFQDIKEYIGEPQARYRVISLGIHPAISQYSGFYTLDSYQNNYPLNYKKQFRKIMSKELNKNKDWRDYYDRWGNRCYLFSSEIKKNDDAFFITKNRNIQVQNLEINSEVFKKMGGKFIFSAVEIINAEENKLKLEKVFQNHDSPLRIFLYKAQ